MNNLKRTVWARIKGSIKKGEYENQLHPPPLHILLTFPGTLLLIKFPILEHAFWNEISTRELGGGWGVKRFLEMEFLW
jgi:hypothetical protein